MTCGLTRIGIIKIHYPSPQLDIIGGSLYLIILYYKVQRGNKPAITNGTDHSSNSFDS